MGFYKLFFSGLIGALLCKQYYYLFGKALLNLGC